MRGFPEQKKKPAKAGSFFELVMMVAAVAGMAGDLRELAVDEPLDCRLGDGFVRHDGHDAVGFEHGEEALSHAAADDDLTVTEEGKEAAVLALASAVSAQRPLFDILDRLSLGLVDEEIGAMAEVS